MLLNKIFTFYCSLLLFIFALSPKAFSVKIKDLVSLKGVRENPIKGIGLVVGLNGTGDGSEITQEALKETLLKMGLDPKKEIQSKNIALVTVTAMLPPFPRIGQKISISVSALSNASSLAGGNLLTTPLLGPDGEIYALAQGALSIGGLDLGKKFPTVARVNDGAIIEKEIPIFFNDKDFLRLTLHEADFTTASRIEKTLNLELGGKWAKAKDSATIDLTVPGDLKGDSVKLMALIENLDVQKSTLAKIIINERTKTIVAGGHIPLLPVAIGHNDLSIQILPQKKDKDNEEGNADKKGKKAFFMYLDARPTLNDLVEGLNALGTKPEDLISIIQTLKQSGAISAQIEFL